MNRCGARTSSRLLTRCLTVTLLTGSLPACSWIALGYNAARYPTTAKGEVANVLISGSTADASLAEQGFEIIDLSTGRRVRTVPPPPGSESIDDLAAADGFLFALDARAPGHLSVFSLADPTTPVLVSGPVEVEVGPFSGVSAGGGNVVVSGGTSELALRTYDRQGRLRSAVSTIDLGRGQPDVLIAPDGKAAFVSTHDWGPYFSLTTLELDRGGRGLVKVGRVDLDTFGFTAGGAKPANFPIEAALADKVLLVAHLQGLAFVSIENLDQPRLLSVLDLGVKAVNVDVDRNVAAVVGSSPSPRLVLVDIANPSAPVIKRFVDLPEGSRATSVSIGSTHIAVAAHKMGTLLFQRHGWSIRPERTSS